MNSPQWNAEVTYSRGPLVKGILKAAWVPALVLIAAFALVFWNHLRTEKQRTILMIAQQMEEGKGRDRWVAAFELTKRLQNPQTENDLQQLYHAMVTWVSRPEMSEDVMLMRYVAVAAGMLHTDPELTVLEALTHHPSENVRLATASALIPTLKTTQVEQHKKRLHLLSKLVEDESVRVQREALLALTTPILAKNLSSDLFKTVETIASTKQDELSWAARLVLSRTQWPIQRQALISFLGRPSDEMGLSVEHLQELQHKTLATIDESYDAEAEQELTKLLGRLRDQKLKEKLTRLLTLHAK